MSRLVRRLKARLLKSRTHLTNRFGDPREPFADLGWDPARQVTR